jgi:inosine/xanthosine triphosphatase
MKIIIGTRNPAKVAAIKEAIKMIDAEFITMDVVSGVSDQPFSDEETIKGAVNRAVNSLREGKGDLGLGLEGGVQESEHGLFLCKWGALAEPGHPPIIAGGARILLPEEIAVRLRSGEELGPVMDDYSKKENVRKQEGAIGIFTNGYVERKVMFTHIVALLAGQYEYRNQQRGAK